MCYLTSRHARLPTKLRKAITNGFVQRLEDKVLQTQFCGISLVEQLWGQCLRTIFEASCFVFTQIAPFVRIVSASFPRCIMQAAGTASTNLPRFVSANFGL